MQGDLDKHINILGWLYIAGGVLFLILGILSVIFFGGIGLVAAADDPSALPILGIIGIIGAVVMTIIGLPSLIAGYGLLKGTSWARVLTMILAVINLFNFPIGTALGVYSLAVLMDDRAPAYFH